MQERDDTPCVCEQGKREVEYESKIRLGGFERTTPARMQKRLESVIAKILLSRSSESAANKPTQVYSTIAIPWGPKPVR